MMVFPMTKDLLPAHENSKDANMFDYRSFGIALIAGAIGFTMISSARADGNWPQFRGPGSTGVADENQLPETWSTTEGVAWKADIPGRGWSSPVVWGDRVFLTSVINSSASEAARKGLYFGGDRPKPPTSEHSWNVYCLDLSTGKIQWEKTVNVGIPKGSSHIKNSFASETPVTDGERVYAYFGNLGIFCLDMEGNVVWSKTFEPHKTRAGWGTAASPVLHKDRVYVVNDNDEESYLLALDKRTGDEAWRITRDERSNWATPYIWENELRTELVTPGTKRVRSYDMDGKELWEFGGMSNITIATPYANSGLLYITSGYVMDATRPIFVIRPGASGDISLKDDETSNRFIAWYRKSGGPYNPSTIVYKDRLYVLYDMGTFASYDAKTGAEIYPKQRLPEGGAFTSSPWAYDDKIFCISEDGVTYVIQAGDEFRILRTNRLTEDDMCLATPAIAGNRLLIRTAGRLYCLQR